MKCLSKLQLVVLIVLLENKNTPRLKCLSAKGNTEECDMENTALIFLNIVRTFSTISIQCCRRYSSTNRSEDKCTLARLLHLRVPVSLIATQSVSKEGHIAQTSDALRINGLVDVSAAAQC